MTKNKRQAILVFLLISMTSSMFTIPTILAATLPTHAFLSVTPNPIGINQEAMVSMWIDRIPPSGGNFAPLALWDYTVEITDPDDNIETRDLESDPLGAAYFHFTPDKLGTYTLVATMHEETFAGTTYLSSSSNIVELVVQSEQIEHWPEAELPEGYWDRPVDARNREWSSIASYWLGIPGVYMPMGTSTFDSMGKFNPYTTSPKTAHIVWTKPIAFGGLVGGQYGSLGYYTGDSYELKGYPAIIMNGIFYRDLPATNDAYGGQFCAIDLRTGEELWRNDGTITFGQLLDYESLNQHGVIPYLWSDQYEMFDAFTGEKLLTFTDITSGGFFGTSFSYDSKGNILAYILNNAQNTFTLWNSTQAILYGAPAGAPGGFGAGNPDYWRPVYGGNPYDWQAGIMYTTDIPETGYNPTVLKINSVDGVVIARQTISATNTEAAKVFEVGYSTEDGSQVWQQLRTGEDALAGVTSTFSVTVGPGLYCVFKQETMQWYAYNITTGEKMWITEPYTDAWGSFQTTIGDGPAYIAYGKLFTTAYDGKLHCYDISDGTHLWDSFVGSSGFETPYGTWPLWGSFATADHKVFVGTGEHSPNQPIPRGEKLVCFDEKTGDILWEISGFMQNPIIADGYLVAFNSYDMQNYCFGKGKTATTVTAPLTSVPSGTGILIQGTVTDQSPGAANTPAISDVDMSAWMEYLYMDQPKPTDVTGVPVDITIITPDGEEITLDTVYGDSFGCYACSWTPEEEGLYTIVANFKGSDAYFGSTAETHLSVGSATQKVPSTTETADELFARFPAISAIDVGIIVAIIVVAVLVVYTLVTVKKQKQP